MEVYASALMLCCSTLELDILQKKPKKNQTGNLTNRAQLSTVYGEGNSTKIGHLVSESELLLFAEERQAAAHVASGQCRNSSSVIATPRKRILVGHQHCGNMTKYHHKGLRKLKRLCGLCNSWHFTAVTTPRGCYST